MIGNPKRRILITNYDQLVEAYTTTEGSGFGDSNVDALLFTGLAKVDVLSGFKALQYTEQGINNPVLIEMNWTSVLPSYLIWNDNKIPITSFVDPDDHFKKRVVMLGSFTLSSISAPLISYLQRRFKTRNDNTLIGLTGEDAPLRLPVSEFDGVDGSVVYNSSQVGVFDFECYVNLNNINTWQHFFGTTANQNRLVLNGTTGLLTSTSGDIYVDNVLTDVITPNAWHKVRIEGVFIDLTSLVFFNNATLTEAIDGSVHSVNFNNELFIPLPHLSHGFDANGDNVDLTVTGGVTEGFNENGSLHLIEKGYTLFNGEIHPNNNEGLPTIPVYDTLINGATFVNSSPWELTLFTLGDTDDQFTFFDKSNRDIWKTGTGGDWLNTELEQSAINANVEDAYKDRLFVKLIGNQYIDILLYLFSLVGNDLDQMNKYLSE